MTGTDDFPLRRDLRALRVDSAPTGDLWPGIQARIALATAHRRRSRRVSVAWLGTIAAAVIAALGMTVLMPTHDPMTGDATVATVASATDGADTVLAAYDQLLVAEQSQAAQWQRRLSLPGGRDRLAAARELDVSLANMAAALRIDPHSQLLRRLMHQTLQQRAALTLDALTA